ncbi:MAG TPA: lysylphosphatidylglycerol synthase transmembrane domain-containing protein [Candidatus Krumholzibacteria bacterium]|nr:lysylphosphatidylglycerol synthase transmembrane domain-containing protein [Candidatus Krumholzibacteria bacterium]
MTMRRVLGFLMPALGLGIFALIVQRTGAARIGAILSELDPWQLLWAPPIILAIGLSRGLRWRYVMRCVGIDTTLRRSTTVWIVGFFASAVTPAKAGDAIRAVYISQDTGRPMGETLLTVFVDRLWDLGFVMVAGIVSAVVFSQRYIAIPSVPLLVAGVLAIVLAVVMMTRRGAMRFLLKPIFLVLVPSRHREGLSANFHTFYDAMRVYAADPRRSVVMAGYTLLCWALIFLLAVYVSRLLQLPVDPRYVVLIMPIVTLVELIPFSISGLGTRDATVIYFFAAVGVGSAEAVGFSIAYLLIGTYLTALLGLVLWLRSPIRGVPAATSQ